MFLLVDGQLRIQLEGREVQLASEEFFVAPRGMLHTPVADDQVGIVLIETVTTGATGASGATGATGATESP